jgi:hypothetical protein
MTAVFTMVTAAILSGLYRASWRGAGAILVTTTVLVLLLGLNISGLGLVEASKAELRLLGEVLGLLVAIFGVYAAVVVALEPARFGMRAG